MHYMYLKMVKIDIWMSGCWSLNYLVSEQWRGRDRRKQMIPGGGSGVWTKSNWRWCSVFQMGVGILGVRLRKVEERTILERKLSSVRGSIIAGLLMISHLWPNSFLWQDLCTNGSYPHKVSSLTQASGSVLHIHQVSVKYHFLWEPCFHPYIGWNIPVSSHLPL